MNLKDAFWNWVVTHAQIIQNVDMYFMFRNASSQNKFRFNLLRCMTKTPDATLQ